MLDLQQSSAEIHKGQSVAVADILINKIIEARDCCNFERDFLFDYVMEQVEQEKQYLFDASGDNKYASNVIKIVNHFFDFGFEPKNRESTSKLAKSMKTAANSGI